MNMKKHKIFLFGQHKKTELQEVNMKDEEFPPLMAGTVQAGFPSPAEHYIERELDLNDFLASNRDAVYYVRVAGESMIGANIFPGDILCVDRSMDFCINIYLLVTGNSIITYTIGIYYNVTHC